MSRKTHKSLHRATLFPSSSTTVSHRCHAWFFSVVGLFLLPLVFAAVCFSILRAFASVLFGIPGNFVHVALKSVGASNVSLITVWIYGYTVLFILLFGYYWAPSFFSFDKLFPLPWFRYRRGHWSHLRVAKLRRAQQSGSFTIFIQGASGGSVPLLVDQLTTSGKVLQRLSALGHIPYDDEGVLVLTTSAGHMILPEESLHDSGLGPLSLLWLRIRILGGAWPEDSNPRSNESSPTDDVPEKRRHVPSGRVTDPSNIGELQLSSHQRAHKATTSTDKDAEGSSSSTRKRQADDVESNVDDVDVIGTSGGPSSTSKGKKPARKRGKKSAGKAADAAEPTEIDADGMLKDIEVQEIEEITEAPSKQNKIRDVEYFFGQPYVDSEGKRVRNCTLCTKKAGMPKPKVNELSTLRRHCQSFHKATYQKWAGDNGFASMLPDDRKELKAAKTESERQTRLDPHLKEREKKEVVLPYTDELFREVSIEWLVATDQPIDAFEHPAFKKMIHIASRASDGVRIPNRKQTRRAIMETFKRQLFFLCKRLQSEAVKGQISLTCDAWQASTTDGYFAVTGHWIEEVVEQEWKLQSALLGFVRLNNSHNGLRLGQALYKVVARYGIQHKVGWVTCDNASNNDTMMFTFAKLITEITKRVYDSVKRRIRCTAHVVNLATQAIITTHSQSKHYDPHNPDEDLTEGTTSSDMRDEVGLVRSIVVKARSSSKRKEKFREIQRRDGVPEAQLLTLLIDMAVRWSSTFVMLRRAYYLKDKVDTFVYDIGLMEKDLQKRAKIDGLRLSSGEWQRVELMLKILAAPNKVQQAFSLDRLPSLHRVLPALEGLHKSWERCSNMVKYSEFWPALAAGLEKVAEYNDRTGDSDAYVMAMLLDPSGKTSHIRKYWGPELLESVLKLAKEIYHERYVVMYGDVASSGAALSSPRKKKKVGGAHVDVDDVAGLLSDEDDEENDRPSVVTADSWMQDFDGYLNSTDVLGKYSIVEWWGHNGDRYPVWASLAADYLAIMASSVSSERAFSASGITISKRRNRLKADVVEALQFLKCGFHQDLIFREVENAVTEVAREKSDQEEHNDPQGSWDDILEENEEECDLGNDDEEVVDVFMIE